MGIFSFFKSKRKHSELEIMEKGMAGIQAYNCSDFVKAKKYFKEYFSMKGTGIFPNLDASDYQMLFNLVFSEFYSKDYASCAATCAKLLEKFPKNGNAYAFSALANNKLGNKSLANQQWEMAKRYGSELVVSGTDRWDTVDQVRMDGYNQ